MKRSFFTVPALLVCAAAMLMQSGCSYHFGSMMHPQLKTIAIGNVVNDTTSFNAAAMVKGVLCEQFMLDGALRLVDRSDADCILFATISSVAFSEVSYATNDTDDDLFLPKEWRASVTINYSLIVPGRAAPVQSGSVSGTADFQVQADMYTNQQQGVRQASREAAVQIVRRITEGW